MTLSFFRNGCGGRSIEEELFCFYFFIKWGNFHPRGNDRKLKPHNSKSQNHNNLCCRLKSHHLQLRHLGDVMYILLLHYYYFPTFPGVSSFHMPWQYSSSPVFLCCRSFTTNLLLHWYLRWSGVRFSVSFMILEIRQVWWAKWTNQSPKMENYKTTHCHLGIFYNLKSFDTSLLSIRYQQTS